MSLPPGWLSSWPPVPDTAQIRRFVHHLRTEGGTPGREAFAIGIGVFVGCSPWYGFHLALCWGLGRLLGLNRLKMYLAANVSNPLVAPFLILSELQTGAWIRRGSAHALTVETVRSVDPWTFGADIVIGSMVVGAVLGAGAGFATWLSTHGRGRDPVFSTLVARASDRYASTGITAWEFARGKMRGDPLYRTVLMHGILPSGGALVDVGCGQGLMLALLAEARAAWRSGAWTAPQAPPVFDALVGVEVRRRAASIARQALGADAVIVTGDARAHVPDACRVILFCDVLHMMPAGDQVQLLRAMSAALEPGGVVLVREADAGAGWRFRAVHLGNRLKALASGHWPQKFQFRSAVAWRELFAQLGFDVAQRGTSEGTPFGNVLFILTRRPHAPGETPRS